MIHDNPIDDLHVNRIFPNKKILDLYGDLPPKNISNDFVRNTCLHNNSLNVDESLSGKIGRGSFGVTRKATYRSIDGSIKNGLIKIIVLSDARPADILELKYLIELNKLIPDHVVGIELIERCDLLKTEINDDLINNKQILLIGMERGISDLHNFLKTLKGDAFIEIISEAMDACDMMNRAGYLHDDIKPANMIVNNRNGIIKPLIIDFGLSKYLPEKFGNPPIDALLLGLFMLKYQMDYHISDRHGFNKKILLLIQKYELIIKKLGASLKFVKSQAIRHLKNYGLDGILSNLNYWYKKNGIEDRELSQDEYYKYIHKRNENLNLKTRRGARINIDRLNILTQSREILGIFKEELRRIPSQRSCPRPPLPPVGRPSTSKRVSSPRLSPPKPPVAMRPAAGTDICKCIVQSSKLRCKNKSKTVNGFCLVHKNCTTIFRGPASPPHLSPPRRTSPPRLSPPRLSPPRPSPPRLSPPRPSSPRLSPPRLSPPRLSPPRLSPPKPQVAMRPDLKNCFPRQTRNGNDLSLEEAKELARVNRISIKGKKIEICNRLRNNRPPLCL